MYRIQLKPYKHELMSKKRLDTLIVLGKLDKKKIWIEFQPILNLSVGIVKNDKVQASDIIYRSKSIGWNFDKALSKLFKLESEINFKLNGAFGRISFWYYSSWHVPGVIIDDNIVSFSKRLKLSIDVDGYPIYKEKYRYNDYPWDKTRPTR
jgi:hypothetical protein